MYNQKKILNIYNQISDEELTRNELLPILPKLYMILNKIKIDQIDLINVIDVLKEFREYHQLESINPETIDLINKITYNDYLNLDGTLYFPMILKHLLLPYNKNICREDYNIILFLSEFEIFIELINKNLSKKDLILLDKYNHNLKEVIVKYKESQKIYNKYVRKDVILNQMISHFVTMLYFNLEDFNYEYELIIEIMYNIIENYQEFIDYCCSLEIHRNYTRVITDIKNIELEYITSYNMLKYLYDTKKEKVKRK